MADTYKVPCMQVYVLVLHWVRSCSRSPGRRERETWAPCYHPHPFIQTPVSRMWNNSRASSTKPESLLSATAGENALSVLLLRPTEGRKGWCVTETQYSILQWKSFMWSYRVLVFYISFLLRDENSQSTRYLLILFVPPVCVDGASLKPVWCNSHCHDIFHDLTFWHLHFLFRFQ